MLSVVTLLPTETFAELNVLISGGFAAPYQEMLPAFEKSAGITVTTARGASQGNGPNTIPAQLRKGLPVDLVIMSKEGLEELIAEGRVDARSAVDLAQAPLGVAVRAGLAKPDISTVEAFKQMLLGAKSVNIVSTTRVYATRTLFPRLGIVSEMAAKINDASVEGVVKGEADLAVRPVSEIVNVPGLDFVGRAPNEVQFVSIFTAAITTSSKQSEAARRLIAFLSSEVAKVAMRKCGMEPTGSQ